LEGKPLRIRTCIVAVLSVLAVGLADGVPPSAASSISQAFYLYSTRDTNIHANCIWRGNRYLAYNGVVVLHPYYAYRSVADGSSSGGIFETDYSLEDGFSTAIKDLYCRNGDFVYEYFGDHMVQRKETYIQVCYGMSCFPIYWSYTPWRSKNWL
jgi:hypothetical protein